MILLDFIFVYPTNSSTQQERKLIIYSSVDGEQTHSSSVVKKTLNPYWNYTVSLFANPSSVLTVQLFDQRKWKKDANQGFLGVANIPLAPLLGLDGTCYLVITVYTWFGAFLIYTQGLVGSVFDLYTRILNG